MLDPTPKYIEEIIRQIKHLQSDIIISKANFSEFQENIKELTIEEVEAKFKYFDKQISFLEGKLQGFISVLKILGLKEEDL